MGEISEEFWGKLVEDFGYGRALDLLDLIKAGIVKFDVAKYLVYKYKEYRG